MENLSLAAVFGGFLLNTMNLETFYGITRQGIENRQDHVTEQWFGEFSKTLANGFDRSGKAPIPGPAFVRDLSTAMAARSNRMATQTVDCAALVFSHTLLDTLLSDCCHLSFSAQPSDWYQFVRKRKIELAELESRAAPAIIHQTAHDFVKQLGRESMKRRLQLLNQVCAPRTSTTPLSTAWIEEEQLETFDRLRQKIIHGQPFSQRIKNIEKHLYFSKSAGFSLLMLLTQAYGMPTGKLDGEKQDRSVLRLCVFLRRQYPECLEVFDKHFGKS